MCAPPPPWPVASSPPHSLQPGFRLCATSHPWPVASFPPHSIQPGSAHNFSSPSEEMHEQHILGFRGFENDRVDADRTFQCFLHFLEISRLPVPHCLARLATSGDRRHFLKSGIPKTRQVMSLRHSLNLKDLVFYLRGQFRQGTHCKAVGSRRQRADATLAGRQARYMCRGYSPIRTCAALGSYRRHT